ncbi:transcription factor MYB82 [Ziziphus jujuba]|uniref:Myb-related protein 123 n=2 Tax=Ziziphus jujuba TaxID=326968 RepID=A0A6P3YU32_ZIZJJ|nr:transcription factor MYB82 [Ziziphus jujuba]KAH7546335.1 hypothetical protein FEM48_Zijuj01G0189900 [Ziziphus jujuba var. spinosa]
MMENKRVKPQPKKNLWKPEEDLILKNYVETHGEGNWATVSKQSGLMRGGKSCRLRWKNYLRPNIKRGGMSQEEEDLIIRMHKLLGNRWSLIAGRLPGRTDNEVKNYWNTHLNKSCPRAKRRPIESNQHQNNTITTEDEEDTSTIKKKNNNKIRRLCNPSPSINRETQEDPSKRKEEQEEEVEGGTRREEESFSFVTNNPWIPDDKEISFNYNIESPIIMPANNATFVLDDEPFIAYMDSFLLFEAFGWSGSGEDCYAESTLGMESIIP